MAVNELATIAGQRVTRFDPEARAFEAYSLAGTKLLGSLGAATLEQAQAEATERWPWDRGDRLGIRETGQEDAPTWPFDKQPVDRLHVFAIRKSAPMRWKLSADRMRSEPVCKFTLDPICTVDLRAMGAGR